MQQCWVAGEGEAGCGSLISTPSRDFEGPSILWKGFEQRTHQRLYGLGRRMGPAHLEHTGSAHSPTCHLAVFQGKAKWC